MRRVTVVSGSIALGALVLGALYVAWPFFVAPHGPAQPGCADPLPPFATFYEMTTGPDPSPGTVTVGSAVVPARSMYISGGAPGEGTLCVSAPPDAADPIAASIGPRAGAIGYAGVVYGNLVYFAVRPGVSRVEIRGVGGQRNVSLDGTRELALQPLADGWHVADSGFGTDAAEISLQAFGPLGVPLETVVLPLGPAPTPSGGSVVGG